jgi:hypothetical protein
MEIYLRVAELYLEADSVDDAETQVNRASLLQNEVKDIALLTRYKALYARVLDRRARFTEAAQRYHEVIVFINFINLILLFFQLSINPALIPSDKRQVLQNALTCTLLAPPGPFFLPQMKIDLQNFQGYNEIAWSQRCLRMNVALLLQAILF